MSSPNEMRKYLAIMRGKKSVENSTEKIDEAKMTKRNILKMRKLQELKDVPDLNIQKTVDVEKPTEVKIKHTTSLDQKDQEEKMRQFFAQNNVTIEFEPLEVYDNGVFWGGTIDGQLGWVIKVTPHEETSGIDVEYLKDFNAQDPENEEIIKKLQHFYDSFYKYWRDNEIQK